MHYRELNTVTKFDKFLLLRIDNLLGQLGSTKFFTTLDLASGFWQVQVHSDLRTKTAYVTPQWLYVLRMMPFGSTLAPTALQHLMHKVFMDPKNSADFVCAHINDILVYSDTLEQHLDYATEASDGLTCCGWVLVESKQVKLYLLYK